MSLHKRKDGRWKVNYRDEEGKIKTKTFSKGKAGKNRAKEFDAEIKYKKASKQPLPEPTPKGIYLGDLTQEWLDMKKAQGRSLKWLREWAHVLSTYILPDLTHKPAKQLTQADILAVIGNHWAKCQTVHTK